MQDELEIKYSRYDLLINTLKEVEDFGMTRTCDWYDKHYDILKEYRENFSDFSMVDSDITEKEFRQKASLSEIILTKLMSDYESHRWFGLYDYARLNRTLIWMAEYSRDFHKKEETDLSMLFTELKF